MAVHIRKLLSMALILAMLLSISIPGLGVSVYAADEPGDGVLVTSADDVTSSELEGTEELGEPAGPGDPGEAGSSGAAGAAKAADEPGANVAGSDAPGNAPLTAPVPFGITATSADTGPIISVEYDVDETAGTVVLTFSIENNPGIDSFYFAPSYIAQVLEYDEGSFWADPFFEVMGEDKFVNIYSGVLDSIELTNYNDDWDDAFPFTEDGVFLIFGFKIKDDVPADEYSINLDASPYLHSGGYVYSEYFEEEAFFPLQTTLIEFEIGDAGSAVHVETVEIIDPDTGEPPVELTIKNTSPGYQLSAVAFPDGADQSVTWSSSNRWIATVDNDGFVKPYYGNSSEVGPVTITATAVFDATKFATCTVTVVPSVTDVHFYIDNAGNGAYKASVPLAALSPQETFQLYPAFSPPDAVGLPSADKTGVYTVWKSSAPDIVTVDQDGLVTAGSEPGWAFVKFTATDGGGRYYAPLLFCVLDPEVTGSGPAASVNGTEYATLSAAAAVGAGQTITLLRDQEAGVLTLPEGSTLDLNDHMLYASQVLIPENTAVVSIENGTIIGKHTGNLNNIQQNLPAVTLSDNSSLESLSNVEILCAQKTPVGGVSGGNVGWTLESLTDCDITAIFSDPKDGTGVFATPEEKEGLAYLQATLSAALGVSGSGDYLYIGGDTRVNVIGGTLIDNGYGEVFIYGGEFDVPRIKTGSTVMHIYGGKYRSAINESAMSGGDEIYGVTKVGDWWVVAVGGTPTELTVNVAPSEAVSAGANVTLFKLDGDTETEPVTPDPQSDGSFVFPVNMQSDYKYTVTANGYVTATGFVSVTGKNRELTVTLRLASDPVPDEDRGIIYGGTVITEGGTYTLAPPVPNERFGVITVATREPVRIVGRGIGEAGHEGERLNIVNAGVMYSDLVIDSCAGANLTIKNVWTNNSHGQGTASGATNLGYTALNFTGKNNTLTVEGVNLLENQEYVSSACIHVPKNAELTFKGEGTLYLYKASQGNGIGGNSYEACGKLTFESGNYFFKGSKTGALIGGDAMGGSVKNDDIYFSGANVVLTTVATGSGVGDSNNGECAGNVYLTAGNLTTYTEFMGPAVGKGGNFIVTGGSYKPVMTENALGPGFGLGTFPPGLYVRDDAVTAAKKDGAGNPVSLLAFDTAELLRNPSANFIVTGAITYTGGLHTTGYDTASTNTVQSFPSDYTDTNLYFYLPMTANQELIVNGETFTVSWDEENESFGVYRGGGYIVNLAASANGSLIASRAEAAEYETVTVAVNPNEGYRFVTGSLKLDGTALATTNGVGRFTMPGKDVTLTAEFEALPPEEYDETRYTVDISDGIYGGRVEAGVARGLSGQKVTLTVVPDTGFRLKPGSLKANGAAVSQTGETYFFLLAGANITITAEFESLDATAPNGNKFKTGDAAKDFVLYIPMDFSLYDEEEGISLTGPNGSLTLTDNDYTVTEGSTVVTIKKSYMNALPPGNYTLSVPFAGNVLVTASFAIANTLVYDITVTPAVGGSLSASPAKAGEGETVTVTVTPDTDYRLVAGSLKWDGWAINADANGAYNFTMPARDVTLTAEFIKVETPATPPPADEDAFKDGIRGSGDIYAAVWDGKSIDLRWFDPARDTYTINTPAELAGLAALVNGLYNREIDTIAGNASHIVVNTGFGDDNGALGNNKSTPAYHYGEYDFAGKTIRLGRDIYMGENNNYMPIGGQYLMTRNKSETRVDASFNGTFDGGNHSVYIYTDRQVTTGNYGDGQSVGLIGRLGNHDNEGAKASGQTVKNVAVYGSVKANRSVGGIVGKIGQTMDGATIDNCANFASVSSSDAKGVGGIVGAAWNKGVIRNCYNAGTVNAGYASPAGGIGGSVEIQIENSYSHGRVTAPTGYAMGIGTRNLSAPSPVNSYYLEGSAAGGGWYTGSSADNKGVRTSEYMKSDDFVTLLGSAFVKDTNGINSGYPVLRWQGGSSVTTPPTSGTDSGSRPTVNIPSTTTVKDGEAVTVIDIPEEGLALADSPSSRLIVDVDTGEESVNKITAEMPAEFIKQASESNSEIEVRSEVANVLLPEKAVTELAEGGKDVSVKAEKDEAADTYTFTVESDGKAIATVEGGIRAAIPVSDASVGTVAILVHEDGTEEIIKKSAVSDGELLVPLAGSATIKIEDRSKSFSDVSANAWYTDAVKFVTSRELFNGTSETEFSPNASMTRAMLVTVLYRLENEPETGDGDLFSDVSATGYYARAVAWASENGIVEGVGEGIFSPNTEITREQLAAILYRYASAQGLDVSARSELSSFMDANNVSSWAGEALAWAVGSGIITGRSNPAGTELAPKGTATRAEVAAMIERLIERTARF